MNLTVGKCLFSTRIRGEKPGCTEAETEHDLPPREPCDIGRNILQILQVIQSADVEVDR